MRAYRVSLSGENLVLRIDDDIGRFGFEVVRFVRAATDSEAADLALALILQSPQLASALNDPGDPPTCAVTEVRPLGEGQDPPDKQPGFAFYPMDDDSLQHLH